MKDVGAYFIGVLSYFLCHKRCSYLVAENKRKMCMKNIDTCDRNKCAKYGIYHIGNAEFSLVNDITEMK